MRIHIDRYHIRAEDPFWNSFDDSTGWPVDSEWDEELYRYIILGLPSGGFHTSVFANDLTGAAMHTHYANTWDGIVQIVKWIYHVAPHEAKGSYENVDKWVALTKDERKVILERCGLLLKDDETMWEILKK